MSKKERLNFFTGYIFIFKKAFSMKRSWQVVGCWHCGELHRLVSAPFCWQRVQHCVKAHCDGEGQRWWKHGRYFGTSWSAVFRGLYSRRHGGLWRIKQLCADFRLWAPVLIPVPSYGRGDCEALLLAHLTSGFHWLDVAPPPEYVKSTGPFDWI